jgi:hypothetical protein
MREIQTDTTLAGWVILLDGGCHGIVGKPAGDRVTFGGRAWTHLEPAYHLEGALNMVGDARQPGRVDVQRPIRVSPILGLVSVRSIPWPADRTSIQVDDLNGVEHAKLVRAVAVCEEIVQKLRLEDAGISVKSTMPRSQ